MTLQSFADADISLTCRTYTDGLRAHRPLSPTLERATTFQAADVDEHRALWTSADPAFYQRFGHPTVAFVAERLAQLDRAEGALLFASGMGAISTTLLGLLSPGQHLVSHHRVFAQTSELIRGPLARMGISHTFVDAREPANVRAAITDRTGAIFLETPSNPWLDVQDIAAIATAARSSDIAVIVDGTFASPILQKPLELGAAVVVHSATKYLGGHSDVMAGVVAGSRDLLARIREWQILLGSVLSPDAAWMLFRGLRTLGLRVPRQSATAGCIAATLASHPAIRSVLYPGLGDNEIPAGQMLGGGGMVSFELRDSETARRFVDGLTSIPVATSLGGVETTVELPLELDFERDAIGSSPPGLVRLSVGLESADELLADLVQALDTVDAARHG